MILHCYYCALGGDRPSEASRVAEIEGLHYPLRADMFKPLDKAHDPTQPFQSNEWRYMIHRACGKYPWPYDVDPVKGPSRVLTDDGFVDIPTNNVPDSVPDSVFQDPKAITIAKYHQPSTVKGQMMNSKSDIVKCDTCGKICKSPLGLNSHKRSHK